MSQLNTITVMSPQVIREATKLAPMDVLQKSSWFRKLTPKVQETIVEETKHVAGAIRNHGAAGLAIGQHLLNIREAIPSGSGRVKKGAEERGFKKYLRTFNFSARTAYRYITAYENARGNFPPAVLEAAIITGVKLVTHSKERPFGAYQEAVKALPPPRTTTEEGAKRYLGQLESFRKERNKRSRKAAAKKPVVIDVGDPKTMLKECYRFFNIRFEKLPSSPKKRVEFVEQLAGMFLAKAGVSHMSIKATAIPEEFQPVLGRPKLVKDDQAAQASA